MLFSVTSAKTMVILQRIAKQKSKLIFMKIKMNVQIICSLHVWLLMLLCPLQRGNWIVVA